MVGREPLRSSDLSRQNLSLLVDHQAKQPDVQRNLVISVVEGCTAERIG